MRISYLNKADLLIALMSAVLFLFFSFSGFSFFESLEKVVYGTQMRLNLPQNLGENKIAIVNIDEKSLEQLGPWPWPRSRLATMITILKGNGARFVGLDLLFSEPEHNQGLKEVRDLYRDLSDRTETANPGNGSWVLGRLREIENRLDNDTMLAQAVQECGNVVMPVLGAFGKYETEVVLPRGSFIDRNSLKNSDIEANIERILPVNQLTTPFAELSEYARGLGHNNLSPDRLMKGLVHLLFIDYRGHILPSMALRLALDYMGKTPQEIVVPGQGIRLSGELIPTYKGEILIKFRGGRRSFPYYSFVDILNVRKVPAVFDDKIVLIGHSAEHSTAVSTPVDMAMPRVELIANIIDNLIHGRYLKRPASMVYVEGILLVFATLLSAVFLPRFGFLNRMGVTAASLFFVFLIGVFFFVSMDVWFKTVYIAFSLITVYIALSVKEIVVSQRKMGEVSLESIETNRMLGLSLQSQGLLDLAFEKFRKCPLDDAMKDVVYNLGLDYERKRMTNKAIAVYEYITQKDKEYRRLNERISKLKSLISPMDLSRMEGKKEAKIVVSDDLGITPTVGRYEIISELGQGAMGIVYKAKDPKINRLVAIKTIRFSDEFEEAKVREVKERFLREAEIAGQLSHPCIVAIYDVGEDYDLTYMAMEFLEGDDLHKYCQKGALLPLRKVLFIIGEAAAALDYSHSQGVIHRDVKPANIMLLKDGKVKVTDFGIAKAVSSSQTKSGVILGTPNYMSPEQINGHKIDGRSDVFSLGVVFYEMLAGRLPFVGKNLTNLFYQITQGRHPSIREINPKIPKPVEQILDRALTKDPEQRFQRAGELAKYVKAMIQKIDQARARSR
ncbi:MAG: CHASE2 domain-containing protein [Deltaproteobacteria bacterium]|nr:CHASE2 domain-containing protein [Deltaproteobacteria bacterium]